MSYLLKWDAGTSDVKLNAAFEHTWAGAPREEGGDNAVEWMRSCKELSAP